MPATKGQWAYALDPTISQWFSLGYNGLPQMRQQLFNVIPSEVDSEFTVGFGGVAPEVWDTYKNSGTVPELSFDQGYKTTFQHDLFVGQIRIDRTLWEDKRDSQILNMAQDLGNSAALKQEVDAASLFNNYTTATILGGDGKPLCDNAHPNSPAKSAATQDNLFASTALSADNVETVRQAMLGFKDDAGNIVGVNPDLLLVPVALENTAKNITGATGLIGSADNDINPQAGRFNYIVWPRLSSSTTWFLIDSAMMKRSLLWYSRIEPTVARKNEDDTIFATWICRFRYSFGWRDWRWIAGCAA